MLKIYICLLCIFYGSNILADKFKLQPFPNAPDKAILKSKYPIDICDNFSDTLDFLREQKQKLEVFRQIDLEEYNEDLKKYSKDLDDYSKYLEKNRKSISNVEYEEINQKIVSELNKTKSGGEYIRPYQSYLNKYQSYNKWIDKEMEILRKKLIRDI